MEALTTLIILYFLFIHDWSGNKKLKQDVANISAHLSGNSCKSTSCKSDIATQIIEAEQERQRIANKLDKNMYGNRNKRGNRTIDERLADLDNDPKLN